MTSPSAEATPDRIGTPRVRPGRVHGPFTHDITVRLSSADRVFCKNLGRGNIAEGVRAAIRIARIELEKTLPGSVAGLEA